MSAPRPASWAVPEERLMCRPTENGVFTLDRAPTTEEWAVLQRFGFAPVRLGTPWRRATRCPVNGDGYWTWYRSAHDPHGHIVGKVFHADGGEL